MCALSYFLSDFGAALGKDEDEDEDEDEDYLGRMALQFASHI
jgi:hypothetical protein